MIVSRDYRSRGGVTEITISMSLTEFRETVEWLELIADRDTCTHDWRTWLNDVAPEE